MVIPRRQDCVFGTSPIYKRLPPKVDEQPVDGLPRPLPVHLLVPLPMPLPMPMLVPLIAPLPMGLILHSMTRSMTHPLYAFWPRRDDLLSDPYM